MRIGELAVDRPRALDPLAEARRGDKVLLQDKRIVADEHRLVELGERDGAFEEELVAGDPRLVGHVDRLPRQALDGKADLLHRWHEPLVEQARLHRHYMGVEPEGPRDGVAGVGAPVDEKLHPVEVEDVEPRDLHGDLLPGDGLGAATVLALVLPGFGRGLLRAAAGLLVVGDELPAVDLDVERVELELHVVDDPQRRLGDNTEEAVAAERQAEELVARVASGYLHPVPASVRRGDDVSEAEAHDALGEAEVRGDAVRVDREGAADAEGAVGLHRPRGLAALVEEDDEVGPEGARARRDGVGRAVVTHLLHALHVEEKAAGGDAVAAHAVLSSADGDPPAEPQGFLENVYDVALVSREEDAVNHRPAEVRHAGDIVHEAASADGVSGGGWWRVRPYAVLELAGRGAAVLANGVGRRAARSSIYSRGLRARECSFVVARPRPAASTTP